MKKKAFRKSLVAKSVKQNDDGTYTFILSDEKPDRDRDIVRQAGLSLADFKKNPMALFGHRHDKIIGKWHNAHINEKNQLQADLELAPDDVSGFQKAVNKLVEYGFLKATSIGFGASEYEPMSGGGYDITKSELREASLVAVGANPRALSLAKNFCEEFDTELGDDSEAIEEALLKLEKSLEKSDPEEDPEDNPDGDPDGEEAPSSEIETPNLDSVKSFLKTLGE